MAVTDVLTGSVDGAGKTGTEDQRVQTALKELHKDITGVTNRTGCLLHVVAHLTLVYVVLQAKLLLLDELLCVVRKLRTTAAVAVLSRRMSLPVHDLTRLGRNGKAELPRQLYLRAIILHVYLASCVVGAAQEQHLVEQSAVGVLPSSRWIFKSHEDTGLCGYLPMVDACPVAGLLPLTCRGYPRTGSGRLLLHGQIRAGVTHRSHRYRRPRPRCDSRTTSGAAAPPTACPLPRCAACCDG